MTLGLRAGRFCLDVIGNSIMNGEPEFTKSLRSSSRRRRDSRGESSGGWSVAAS
jgi:hypothetical protein